MNWIKEHVKLAVLTIVIIFLVAIIVISAYHPGSVSAAGEAAQTAAAAAEEPLTDASSGIRGFFSGLFGFRSLQRENYELRQQVADLNEQLTQAELDEQTLNQLRELAQSLNYASYDDSYEKVTADVIATDGSNIFNIFTINAGSDDGITAGSVVVNEDGLIGKVTTVGKDWSKVLSIVDANDSVSFTLLRDPEVVGVLSGDGEGGLSGYIFDEEKSLNSGDILITSGMSLYPAGITIGSVESVEYDESSKERRIYVEPQVNFRAVRMVTVLISG